MPSGPPIPVYPSELDFFDALRRREDNAYQLLYSDIFPKFQYWVRRNNGTDMDAEDAFQKGLLSFLLNIETGKYQLQESARITTVAFDYCKKVWLTELGSARLRYRSSMPDQYDTPDASSIVSDLERIDLVNVVQKSLNLLGGECRKLLEWFYVEELALREIAQRLGLKESSVKSKRYQCAEKWKAIYLLAAKQQEL